MGGERLEAVTQEDGVYVSGSHGVPPHSAQHVAYRPCNASKTVTRHMQLGKDLSERRVLQIVTVGGDGVGDGLDVAKRVPVDQINQNDTKNRLMF